MKTKVFVLRSLFIGIGIFCFLGLFVLISSIGLLNGIKSRKVAAVARHSRHLHLLSQPLSVLTLKSNATIETVTASLGILSQSEAAQQAVTEIVQATATQDIELQPLLQLVIDIQPELET